MNENQAPANDIQPVDASIPQDNIIPEGDFDIDNALNKAFKKTTIEPANEPVKPEVKESPAPVESKKQEVKNEKAPEKAIVEKPILTPEEVDKLDPKGQQGWNAIRASNKKAHAMLQDRDAEITKLKTSLAEKGSTTTKEVEQLKSEISELAKYRAMVDIQADPEFVSKFDQPIEKSRKAVLDILKSEGVTEEALGNFNFSDTKVMSEVIGIIAQKDRIKATKFERLITDLIGLSDQRNEALSNHKNTYKETLEKKKQESFAKEAEGDGRMIQKINSLMEEKTEKGEPKFPFLFPMEVPDGSDKTALDRATQHNEMVKEFQGMVNSVSKMKEPEQRAEINIAAVASHYIMRLLNAERQAHKATKDELAKISTVTSEGPRKTNVPRGTNGRYTNGNGDEPQSLDSSLGEFFKGRR